MKTKKCTILHSNDMHGDFLAEVAGEKGPLKKGELDRAAKWAGGLK